MSKKISAAFLVLIFVLSIALIATPVQAHYTLGRPTWNPNLSPTAGSPYHARDYDPHAYGPLGHVWPGSGMVNVWQQGGSGAPTPTTWGYGPTLPPGYQSPWGVLPSGAPSSSWYQLAGNAYAPFGAVMTSTDDFANKGDLIFGINFSRTIRAGDAAPYAMTAGQLGYNYTSLTIYIPPEFTPPVDWSIADTSNIVTTITNDYGWIYCWKADLKDPFGPGYWVVYISGDIHFWKALANPNHPAAWGNFSEWYYVRINGMTAPKIAGKYNFKMFLNESFPTRTAIDDDGLQPRFVTSTMPAENWPVLLVKGEVDPGIVEGTVRYGAWNQQLYNQPIRLPGVVRAVGIANDPYTGASTGRNVEARGYFNASARGHYEVEGVAPGVYDIYASAAGYPETKVASGVIVNPGKSLHLDILLQPGPTITGVIYSKHSFGEVTWPSTRPVTVEIYDSNEWPSAKPGYAWGSEGLTFERDSGEMVWTDTGYDWSSKGHLKSFSPTNLTDSPFTSYVWGNTYYDATFGYTRLAGEAAAAPAVTPNNPKRVAFPWEGPLALPAVPWVGYAGGDVQDPRGLFNGVGPQQHWWVDRRGIWTNGGGANSFRFQFGIEGFYGAPMDFDGHVPQVYATWTNGLTAGNYYLRAWVNGYVQTDVSGTYTDYAFSVAANEWAGDINTPMDLETSSWINKTVHFHNLPGTLQESPIQGPDHWRYLVAEAYDADNILVSMNFTQVWQTHNETYVTLNGFGMAGPDGGIRREQVGQPTYPCDGSRDMGMKFFMYRYRHIRDYGIMPGTYTIRVFMRGYVQQEFESATISLSSSPAIISNHMYRGAGINMTVYSIDWEHPRVDRPWTFPGDEIRIQVYYDPAGANTYMGYVRYYTGADGNWSYPTQMNNRLSVPNVDWLPADSKLKFNGSWALELYGPDLEGFRDCVEINNRHDGDPQKTDAQTGIWLEFGWDWFGFLASPANYRSPGSGVDGSSVNFGGSTILSNVGLETGTYELKAYTLGYVQKKAITVYAQKGSQADTKINLAQGVNITANIKFKKEGIYTHVPYNSSFKIRVFDDSNELVATWMSSMYDASGFYNGVLHTGITTPLQRAYGGYGIGPSAPAGVQDTRPWVMDSTTDLQVMLAGHYFYWEVDQECQCGASANRDMVRVHRGYGIDGYPNYQGSYRIEVDVVNWYQSNLYFPAPPGLLLGESYHIINGVEGPYGGLFKYNHLGPWEQRMEIVVPNAHLGAEASVVFELDLRGLVSGQIAGFTWSDELRPVSWGVITASGAAGTFTSYSWDGYYDMYLPTGSYELTVSAPGQSSVSQAITVSTGQLVTGFSFYLERSMVPIPEFPVAIIGLVAALGASMYILRRTTRRKA